MAPNFLFKDKDFKTRQRFFYSRQITQNLLSEDFNKDGLDSSDSEEEIKPAKKQR
ncbi:hypothetical protein PGT21_019775 [Puccinia graminis f. sp. tritici]|uniref:Uncharacterized protein n=1 Tax=Puccinia graminis f. sp. tritici TaxID=56615 RepID=A0A5B0M5E2_PUCGR|nr:hypothetical protein PGTUg99_010581 [Puccinia graminis f. sp. tritici]KAA1094383.1 hypothetical protein PGT21_019775 [Puccinia graminis f. sp. tritici]